MLHCFKSLQQQSVRNFTFLFRWHPPRAKFRVSPLVCNLVVIMIKKHR